jgi:hypothetical protein
LNGFFIQKRLEVVQIKLQIARWGVLDGQHPEDAAKKLKPTDRPDWRRTSGLKKEFTQEKPLLRTPPAPLFSFPCVQVQPGRDTL